MSTPNFNRAKLAAGSLLSIQEHTFYFSIDTRSLVMDKNVILDSIQNYASITGLDQDYDNFCKLYYGLRNGCTIRIGHDVHLILYDEHEKNKRRLNWSIAHEIGHIYLGHQVDQATEEVEANFFASQLLAPDVVLAELMQNGVPIDVYFLRNRFFLSMDAARRKMQYLQSRKFAAYSELDEKILQKYRKAIDRELMLKKISHGRYKVYE